MCQSKEIIIIIIEKGSVPQFRTYPEGYFHFFSCGYQARVAYFHQCNDIFLRRKKNDKKGSWEEKKYFSFHWISFSLK